MALLHLYSLENIVKISTLIIPVAGLGTRLRPATYTTSKELLRLVDKPIIYYLLAEAHLADIGRVVLITHSDNTQTKDFFESPGATMLMKDFPGLSIEFVETTERSGDGQALLSAESILRPDESFAVSMGDLVTLPGQSILRELVAVFEETGNAVVSVEPVPPEKTMQYGVIDPVEVEGPLYSVRAIVEKPAPAVSPSNLAMTGKYILDHKIFPYLHTLMSGSGELKLANALDVYARERTLLACVPQTRHYDTGTKLDLFKAEVAFTLSHPELADGARKAIKEALP